MAINLPRIRDLLVPGLRDVVGEYPKMEKIYDKIYETGTSTMAVERTVSMRYLGLAMLKTEGGATSFDNNAGERYVWNQEHTEIGLGYAITRKAIDDNQYRSKFKPSNLGLQNSFAQTKELYGAAPLNNATIYNPAVVGDGKALCAVDHPIEGSTFANRPAVDVDLNEATLLGAQAAIRTNFRDNAGLRMRARARLLVVPVALEPVAVRLLDTDLRPGTADNDVNAIKKTSGGIPKGFIVHDYLNSPYAWFLLTDQPGMLFLQRIPFEMDMQVDFTTENLMVKGYERYSFGNFDPRAIYGSFPLS